MQEKDFDQFVNLWLSTYQIYQKKQNDFAVKMVFKILQNFEIEDIRRALISHMQDTDKGCFAPKPADLILHIEGDSESRAYQAWTKLINAVAEIGVYQTVVFDDELIMKCVEEMGGWIRLNSVNEKELPFLKNEFVKRYRGFIKVKPFDFPNKLLGLSDAENQKKGYNIGDPVLIGDKQMALSTYNCGETLPKKIAHNLSNSLSEAIKLKSNA